MKILSLNKDGAPLPTTAQRELLKSLGAASLAELAAVQVEGEVTPAEVAAGITAFTDQQVATARFDLCAAQVPYQGAPTNAAGASVGFGADPTTDGIVITGPVAILEVNDTTVGIVQGTGVDTPTTVSLDATHLIKITLGTDGAGDPDGTKSTPDAIKTVFDAEAAFAAFTCAAAGSTPVAVGVETFAGAVEGTPGLLGRQAVHCDPDEDIYDIYTVFIANDTTTQTSWRKTYTETTP